MSATDGGDAGSGAARYSIGQAIEMARLRGASDLHILGRDYIRIRVDRRIIAVNAYVHREDVTAYVEDILKRDTTAKGRFARTGAFDIRDNDAKGGAIRLHVHRDSAGFRLAIRLLGDSPPNFRGLHLPPKIEEFSMASSGLLIIAAPQGMGKSTLAHALVDSINKQGGRSIIVIERPKEFSHVAEPESVIVQQEPGQGGDTASYAQGVISAMNADSNVIVIGQVTSLDEAKAAVDAAVKGCLVILTVHARNTVQGIESLVGWFPPDDVDRVRMQVAQAFIGAVSLRLLPRVSSGVKPVAEVLVTDAIVRRAIASGDVQKIREQYMSQAGERGNLTLESQLSAAVQARDVLIADARSEAVFPDEVRDK